MLKTDKRELQRLRRAYHLGEGRVLKTVVDGPSVHYLSYHLGEGRVLKTDIEPYELRRIAYHLGEGRVLKTEKPRF